MKIQRKGIHHLKKFFQMLKTRQIPQKQQKGLNDNVILKSKSQIQLPISKTQNNQIIKQLNYYL